MDDNPNKRRRLFWWLVVLVPIGGMVALWQLWSWGPYQVQLADVDQTTRDFVITCSYGVAGLHSVTRAHSQDTIVKPGETITCPRRFLGPTGRGMTIEVFHPLFRWQMAHKRDRIDNTPAMVTPRLLRDVLAEEDTEKKRRRRLWQHLSLLEHRYLPQFDHSQRQELAVRYVSQLQSIVREAGLDKTENDLKRLHWIDKLFRQSSN